MHSCNEKPAVLSRRSHHARLSDWLHSVDVYGGRQVDDPLELDGSVQCRCCCTCNRKLIAGHVSFPIRRSVPNGRHRFRWRIERICTHALTFQRMRHPIVSRDFRFHADLFPVVPIGLAGERLVEETFVYKDHTVYVGADDPWPHLKFNASIRYTLCLIILYNRRLFLWQVFER